MKWVTTRFSKKPTKFSKVLHKFGLKSLNRKDTSGILNFLQLRRRLRKVNTWAISYKKDVSEGRIPEEGTKTHEKSWIRELLLRGRIGPNQGRYPAARHRLWHDQLDFRIAMDQRALCASCPYLSYSEFLLQWSCPRITIVCRCVKGRFHVFLIHKSLGQIKEHPHSLLHIWAWCRSYEYGLQTHCCDLMSLGWRSY